MATSCPPKVPAIGPPKVILKVPENREYAFLLGQTATVYNQLLSDKYDKLLDAILKRKSHYDTKCNELAESNQEQALEFAVKAQADLMALQQSTNKELGVLHKDYQNKLTKMQQQLEQKWREERLEQANVNVKVYPHK